ncbi:MAG: N-acyl homoserine lactonase [Deltaproteobacteria bacterium]|nr:N-acyl homoserine lactonase [Deltaproteobacteria bacterium]
MPATPLNLCNLPPWVIAAHRFNNHPQRLEIQGVRQANRFLFKRLEQLATRELRGLLFHDYMDVTFQLHQWQQEKSSSSRKGLKNSYLRFLRGWMFESNSREGAVLKGWVESRFGLAPVFHHQPIDDIHSEAYYHYLCECMQGKARTNAIYAQFDLLYEFVQYELGLKPPTSFCITLYRGIHDYDEQRVLKELGKHRHLIRLNNLVSFTSDFERAWEFGNRVLRAEVPLAKIVFRADLLPNALLKGEEEVLVIGGEYAVEVLTGG